MKGGKRTGAGRKPCTDKKQQITIYVLTSQIEKLGKDAIRQICERGVFTICEDAKGKCKMFQTSTISIVEINEMPKEKKYKTTARFITENEINKFQSKIKNAILNDNFLECQIKSNNYNSNLIK